MARPRKQIAWLYPEWEAEYRAFNERRDDNGLPPIEPHEFLQARLDDSHEVIRGALGLLSVGAVEDAKRMLVETLNRMEDGKPV